MFSEAKRQKTEESPEKSPEIVLGEDSPSNTSSASPPSVAPETPLSAGKAKLHFILFYVVNYFLSMSVQFEGSVL